MVLAVGGFVPTQLIQTGSFVQTIVPLLENRPCCAVTSAGWRRRGALAELLSAGSSIEQVVECVPPNPTIGDTISIAEQIPKSAEVLVALGGGSVIDTAKAAVAICAAEYNPDSLLEHLSMGQSLPPEVEPIPIIAIPSTAGTGSEVTPYATLWSDNGKKYSIFGPQLIPRIAIYDAHLLVNQPFELSLSTGMDALSHAMEAVWNTNHTPLTDALSNAAMKLIQAHLPASLAEPGEIEHQRQLQVAATLSGIAISKTQTALAHSISYPFTGCFGLTHGLACSFTLVDLVNHHAAECTQRLAPIADAFECQIDNLADTLAAWLKELQFSHTLVDQLPRSIDMTRIADRLLTPSRAKNSLIKVDADAVERLARASLLRWGIQCK